MNGLQRLIAVLADGRFYSKNTLSESLGVPSSEIDCQLRELHGFGVSVVMVEGRGWQLQSPLELLSSERLLAHLPESIKSQLFDIDVAWVVDSTNASAKEKCTHLNGGKVYACLAEYQSLGRGRRGRHWVSPLGRNICLSLAYQFEEGVTALQGLSLAVGVQIVKALDSLGVSGVSLKWPNDVVFGGKKLGGILLEMIANATGPAQIVIGIGLNVDLGDGAGAIDQPFVDISSVCETPISRNALAAELIAQVVSLLNNYADEGFSAYAEQWRALDAFANQSVKLSGGNGVTKGIARGVNDAGELLLEIDGNLTAFHGGELSLRLDVNDDSRN